MRVTHTAPLTHIRQTFRRNKNGYKGSIGGYYTHADNDYRMELPLQKGRYINRDHDGYEKLTIGGTFVSTRWWFDEVSLKVSSSLPKGDTRHRI